MIIKILLLGSRESFTKVKSRLNNEEIKVLGGVIDSNEVLDEINKKSPDIVVITEINANVLRACQQIYLLRPKTLLVCMQSIDDANLMNSLVHSGVHYFISDKINAMNISDEFKSVLGNESQRITALTEGKVSNSKSKVIMIFGTKGGVGKSSFATNLAAKLSYAGRKVALLDFDFSFGNINSYMGINSEKSILELIQEQASPNVDIIRRFMIVHESGVHVLTAPKSPEYADIITPDQVEKIISALRIHYDYVIIDSSANFSENNLVCIDCASEIMFLTSLELVALKDAKKGLDVLSQLTQAEKIKCVINKASKGPITEKDVQKVLNVPVVCKLPEESKAMISSANRGVAIVLDMPKNKYSVEMSKLVKMMDAELVEESSSKNGKKSKISFKKSKKSRGGR